MHQQYKFGDLPFSFNTILIISNEPWDKQWFSKHHYANELCKLGFQVKFLNPPKPWKLTNLFNTEISCNKVQENLEVVSFKNPLPLQVLTRYFTYINDWITFRRIKRKLKLNDSCLVWQFDFNRFVFWPKDIRRLYHVADPYMHAWSDLIVARTANLIVCTSPKYVPYYRDHVDPSKVIHIPHGISLDELDVSEKKVARIEKEHGAFFVLVGSLNDDVDYDLMKEVASKVQLVVLGSEKIRQDENKLAWDELKKHRNVKYLGTIPATELKNYIAAAKCCLLLYRFDLKKAIGTGSPLKVMNYLAQYKPVISSIDPESPILENEAVYWVNSHQEFLDQCDLALAGKLKVNRLVVKEFISKHLYTTLIQQIFISHKL